MVLDLPFKQALVLHISNLLDAKISEARTAIHQLQEAKNNDTKSSAGDKYETGRAMIQMELDKAEFQLHNANQLKKDIQIVSAETPHEIIRNGSLVLTNWGVYFIAVALGKIIFQNQEIVVFSLASPIAQLLKDKSVGERVEFNNRTYEVLGLI